MTYQVTYRTNHNDAVETFTSLTSALNCAKANDGEIRQLMPIGTTIDDPIELIYQFNYDAGLVQRGYDDFLESSFQIEEALEGFPLNALLPILENSHPQYSQVPHYGPVKAKHVARAIMTHATDPLEGTYAELSDVDRLDKACDSVVFAIGSMTKLGLNVEQIKRALNAVMKANLQKLSMPKDEFGKLMKPDDFVGPEAALQAILDEVPNVSLP